MRVVYSKKEISIESQGTGVIVGLDDGGISSGTNAGVTETNGKMTIEMDDELKDIGYYEISENDEIHVYDC